MPASRRTAVEGGRPLVLRVRLSEDEAAQLGELASGSGVSVANLLVQSALSPDRSSPRILLGELMGIRRELRDGAGLDLAPLVGRLDDVLSRIERRPS